MSVGLAALYKGINAAWDASDLDDTFTDLGGTTPVIHDAEATPKDSFPYCVLEEFSSTVVTRMSKGKLDKWQVLNVPVTFRIYAKEVTDDSRTAKGIAAYLAEEVMKDFGGHPTVAARQTITLDSGNHLLTQYQTDYGMRVEDDIHCWTVSYIFKIDQPFMA